MRTGSIGGLIILLWLVIRRRRRLRTWLFQRQRRRELRPRRATVVVTIVGRAAETGSAVNPKIKCEVPRTQQVICRPPCRAVTNFRHRPRGRRVTTGAGPELVYGRKWAGADTAGRDWSERVHRKKRDVHGKRGPERLR